MSGTLLSESHLSEGERLAQLHFTMQHEVTGESPCVEIASLDPLLRSLLFTDGTVTRALEAQTLSRVAVDVVEQSTVAAPAEVARCLEASADTPCLRRRVAMGAPGSPPTVWAESYILAGRLPRGFVDLLDSTSHGIGGSIELARLESRRELLWFRLGAPPHWALPTAVDMAVTRLYRIVTEDRPALLICEAFAAERELGMYRRLETTRVVGRADGGPFPPASE
jgi:chorismate-pyruvate lyase